MPGGAVPEEPPAAATQPWRLARRVLRPCLLRVPPVRFGSHPDLRAFPACFSRPLSPPLRAVASPPACLGSLPRSWVFRPSFLVRRLRSSPACLAFVARSRVFSPPLRLCIACARRSACFLPPSVAAVPCPFRLAGLLLGRSMQLTFPWPVGLAAGSAPAAALASVLPPR